MSEDLLNRRYRLVGKGAPLFYEKPLHVVRGEGVLLFDADGNEYLDAYNNVPVVGHCNPRVVEALTRQAGLLNVHTRYLHENLLDYTERLTATFSAPLDMAILTCTGSEANDVALRMVRELTGKRGIICSNSTYHGNTTAVDELSTMFRGGKSESPNVRAIPFPETYRPLNGLTGEALADAYVNEVQAAIRAFEESGTGFAGMLVCPIFANEGLPDVPAGVMPRIARIVREAGGMLIFDEVQAGFGRTGYMWGHQMIGVEPDIVTMGKPMGNGHPIAGLVSSADIINAFRSRVMYFNTFGGNPVSCAVGLAVLDVIQEERLLDNVRNVGAYVAQGLRELKQRHEAIGDIRARGLFFGVEMVSDRARKTPSAEMANMVLNRMRENGVLISRAGPFDNVLKMRPPLPFTKAHADRLLSTLDQCLEAVAHV
ncbi:aspartate aminotransferase family protein [Ralstonia soli]|uniref:Aspartate aminotransferase family protein n=1 Tax=Ralstonia soli TaxID=2953896 RepID=A0ABT1AGU2_9RALS|nr:aspartate aminotransferase family protein [Ralstonia soli]MCO5397615.1 aspartate aminotransferase family protein [Ralstonia soli]